MTPNYQIYISTKPSRSIGANQQSVDLLTLKQYICWCVDGTITDFILLNKKQLQSVKLKSTFASRSFSVYGPVMWNSLPYNIRNQSSLQMLKIDLKTHLFIREYFGQSVWQLFCVLHLGKFVITSVEILLSAFDMHSVFDLCYRNI